VSEELKPCPCCGGKAELGHNFGRLGISCVECDLNVRSEQICSEVGYDSIFAAWNTRPSPWTLIVKGDAGTYPKHDNPKGTPVLVASKYREDKNFKGRSISVQWLFPGCLDVNGDHETHWMYITWPIPALPEKEVE
jgi:hypothetical protein